MLININVQGHSQRVGLGGGTRGPGHPPIEMLFQIFLFFVFVSDIEKRLRLSIPN